jgi:hypothetical protein
VNIKICLQSRKRPMTLDDLPDISHLVPVGWWQQVIVFDKPEWTSGAIKNVPSKQYGNCADRMRIDGGWTEWQLGKDFATNLAKFTIEAPWTLEEVKDLTGEFRCVAFFDDGAGFEVENIAAASAIFWSVESALEWESLTAGAHRIVIFDQVNRRRVLEVTP